MSCTNILSHEFYTYTKPVKLLYQNWNLRSHIFFLTTFIGNFTTHWNFIISIPLFHQSFYVFILKCHLSLSIISCCLHYNLKRHRTTLKMFKDSDVDDTIYPIYYEHLTSKLLTEHFH